MNTIKSFFGKVFRFIKYSIYATVGVLIVASLYNGYVDSKDPVKIAIKAAQAEAKIIAAIASNGIAFTAEVVGELASFRFLVTDSVHAVSACSTS